MEDVRSEKIAKAEEGLAEMQEVLDQAKRAVDAADRAERAADVEQQVPRINHAAREVVAVTEHVGVIDHGLRGA